MIQRILFLNHKAIGTLQFRGNFRTSSLRHSPKDRGFNRHSFKNLSEKEKRAYWEKKMAKILNDTKELLNIPFRKWDWEKHDFVYSYSPLELAADLIFMYVYYGGSISRRDKQVRFLELLSNILKAKTRCEILSSHHAIWNFLVKKADMDAVKVGDFKDKLSKAYKGKL
jgi:hypothetical protein